VRGADIGQEAAARPGRRSQLPNVARADRLTHTSGIANRGVVFRSAYSGDPTPEVLSQGMRLAGVGALIGLVASVASRSAGSWRRNRSLLACPSAAKGIASSHLGYLGLATVLDPVQGRNRRTGRHGRRFGFGTIIIVVRASSCRRSGSLSPHPITQFSKNFKSVSQVHIEHLLTLDSRSIILHSGDVYHDHSCQSAKTACLPRCPRARTTQSFTQSVENSSHRPIPVSGHDWGEELRPVPLMESLSRRLFVGLRGRPNFRMTYELFVV
jgi:hypothetical protein